MSAWSQSLELNCDRSTNLGFSSELHSSLLHMPEQCLWRGKPKDQVNCLKDVKSVCLASFLVQVL